MRASARRAVLSAIVLTGAAVILPTASAAPSSGRSRFAGALFGKSCLQAPPTFASVDQAASSAGYQVFQNRMIGAGAHQKEWLVPIMPKAAPLLLSVISGPSRNGASNITVCGVSVLGASGPGLQQALSANPRLGRPRKIIAGPHGGTQVYWAVPFGGATKSPDAQVILAYGLPGTQLDQIDLILQTPQ
ncbi:hypothetical protein SAMN05421828_12244 [Acidiphilium rubrum]|uniref:Uncharacterized protein n=1 Tax=Acidiphilium rubrum TaxID=526 RepID=A0A8G2CMN3_ACIRU|nr:hypothetical protein SAMN05421828_12244 [Acidiphilium rubrum]